MAGVDMSRSKSTDRVSPTAVAAVAAARAKRTAAQGQLPTMGAFALINNPSGPQQTAQIKALTTAVESITRGTIGG